MSESKLTGRLREIIRTTRPQAAPGSPAAARGEPVEAGEQRNAPAAHHTAWTVGETLARSASTLLGGEVVETAAGPCVRITRMFGADATHGRLRIRDLVDGLRAAGRAVPVLGRSRSGSSPDPRDPRPDPRDPRPDLQDPRPDPRDPGPDPRDPRLLFVDIETTGLAGGAGTHAFLVGCASVEDAGLRVDQYFMVGHALERALLELVRRSVEASGTLVTYNGKTFDVPVLETRYLFHRQPPPFAGRAHVDMLHIARRLWRGVRGVVSAPGVQSDSCALTAMEQALFGLRRYGDVPGFEIPARFFAFLRSADARPLAPVFEHNRLDLVSLAALTARATRILGECPARVTDARECYGAGRLLEQAGDADAAEAWYERAAELAVRSWIQEEAGIRLHALRALAARRRRQGRYAEAAEYWEQIAGARGCPPALMREALEALAVHCEHRARDLELARRYAERSRALARAVAQGAAVEHRLARLRRKMGDRGPMLVG